LYLFKVIYKIDILLYKRMALEKSLARTILMDNNYNKNHCGCIKYIVL